MVLCCLFLVSGFCGISPYVCSYFIRSVAELPPFGKKLLIRWTICFLLYFDYILVIFRFGFEGWIWVLIASVPDLCIRLTFIIKII